MSAYIKALCEPSLGAPSHVTGILQAKKWTNLNQYISVSTNINEEWFVIFEHTINHLFLGYVYLPQREYNFSFFFLAFYLFYFSSRTTCFYTAKRTVFKL